MQLLDCYLQKEGADASDVSPSCISNDFSVVVDLVVGASVILVEADDVVVSRST